MRTLLVLILLLAAAAPAGAVTRISVVPAGAGPPRTLVSDRGYEIHYAHPVWNADGTVTLLREASFGTTQVLRIDPATGKRTRLLTLGTEIAASLSDTGDVVAWFEDHTGGPAQLRVLDADTGSLTLAARSPDGFLALDWSPLDGTQVHAVSGPYETS